MKDYNEFDGLVHKGTHFFELDGTEVTPNHSSFVQIGKSDVNDDPHMAADARKVKTAAFKSKYNEFDGQIHETDGSSYNKGDGVEVRGINKMA